MNCGVNPYFYEAEVAVGESLSDDPSVGRAYVPTLGAIVSAVLHSQGSQILI